MARLLKENSESRPGLDGITSKQEIPYKPWGTRKRALPKYMMDNISQMYNLLDKYTRERVGLIMRIPVFIQDPIAALEQPLLSVEEIEIGLEASMTDGPTSSRIAVVDFDADTQKLTPPVVWDSEAGWFRAPNAGEWLPEIPLGRTEVDAYRSFIQKASQNPYFHQVNVWALVQYTLEFFEDARAFGRPIPWGLDGNRLIITPHAGLGKAAFYDRQTKSLQFFYFDHQKTPVYPCLSYDIIVHETGHAILDGIRPFYYRGNSIQTVAFTEFFSDLTTIQLSLLNRDIRNTIAMSSSSDYQEIDSFAKIAEKFGRKVQGRPILRTALSKLTMRDVQTSLTPYQVSIVLTGAMFDVLIEIAKTLMERNTPRQTGRRATPAQTLWWAADRFRRVALQPLDLCPPCDIQFLDYARAVLRNDILTNPVDERGYRKIILGIFHQRGLCECGYRPGEELPEDCLFREVLYLDKMDFVYHDIERVARSRAEAYYFLSDNRNVLNIPSHQDVEVIDLYDSSKTGAAGERMPREIVLEYLWQEEVELKGDQFGWLNGKITHLDCGGTLVFDDRGNLLYWSHKPGTDHLDESSFENLRGREEEWRKNSEEAQRKKVKRLTRQELSALEDRKAGLERKKALLENIARLMKRGVVGKPDPSKRPYEYSHPVVAFEEGETVRFEFLPYGQPMGFDSAVTV